jgi:MerR HTH family regulatory protein
MAFIVFLRSRVPKCASLSSSGLPRGESQGSVKALRRYHETGLLQPDYVDDLTGYRYYTTAQVPTAQVIRRFRDLGMPLGEMGEIGWPVFRTAA